MYQTFIAVVVADSTLPSVDVNTSLEESSSAARLNDPGSYVRRGQVTSVGLSSYYVHGGDSRTTDA